MVDGIGRFLNMEIGGFVSVYNNAPKIAIAF
jgi:hypothetical protein